MNIFKRLNMSNLREIFKISNLFKGICVGSVVGVLVAVYRLGTLRAAQSAGKLYEIVRQHQGYIVGAVLLCILIGLVIWKLLEIVPEARGGGLVQVEERITKGKQTTRFEVIIVRYIGGVLGALFGVSLGRAGPSVHLGATSAEVIAKQLKCDEEETNHLMTAGASAGLAATFSAPVSGLFFTYEKMHKKVNPMSIFVVCTAVFVADAISKRVFGLTPILYYVDIPTLSIQYGFGLILLGVCAGCVGVLVTKFIGEITKLLALCPEMYKPCIALLVALVVGLTVPQLLGSGQNLIQLAETTKMSIGTLCVAFVIKLVFTSICTGSGFPGGTFMPVLALGAILGSGVAQVLAGVGVPSTMVAIFCVCGMAGVLASSVGIPLTSILLMVEMTGSLSHIIPIALTTFVATGCARLLVRNQQAVQVDDTIDE